MLVDSHCHLNRIDLAEFDNQLDHVVAKARANDVGHMLCVSVEVTDWQPLQVIAEKYHDVSISVGVHPDTLLSPEEDPDTDRLVFMANHPACVAIGETGLDFYRVESELFQTQQCQRFRSHIQAALQTKKPLIIHTRQAASATIEIMKSEQARDIGGVMHCFTESYDVARQAMDLNFYISFSGIVTFKNALELQEVAKKVPLDRILIETDSPYLAPTPFRGKQNHPALVKHVAEAIADLRGESFMQIAEATTANFFKLFPGASR